MENMNFTVSKFYSYSGPSYYLDRPAMVFNIFIDPTSQNSEFFKEKVLQKFPELAENYPTEVSELFGRVLLQVCKMELNIFINRYAVLPDDTEWTIAVENLDERLVKECVYLVSDWFLAMSNGGDFDFDNIYTDIKKKFDKSLFGGPTIYSLIESGIKRNIPVHYLYEENQFQWGYGKTQRRGRSTIFHTDGIKDTEFTTYKDMCGDFLELCGFPTPKGFNCYSQEEIETAVEEIGFPCVIKPVNGHKGQGVTTGIESMPEAIKAFNNVLKLAENGGVTFDGALVQQQIYGYDHRILTIGGKYVACLKRVPAFVKGDGKSTIKQLIDTDNLLEIRADTARSPLCKIKLDDDMLDFMRLQGLTPDHVPAAGEDVVLRRVANISAGGVSYNVTTEMHPENIRMAENIAKFLNVTALGIDVLAADISKPWQEGNFGIIEINAGPGVFMHLAPAFGGSVDVPGYIMEHFFGKKEVSGRIPIIAGNFLTHNLIEGIYNKLKEIKPDIEFGSVRNDGVYFNNQFFNDNIHDENCKMLMRNPKLDFAVFEHNNNDIHDFGIWHWGLDLAILDKANYAERILERDLIPGGILIEIDELELVEGEIQKYKISLNQNKKVLKEEVVENKEIIDDKILEYLSPYLKELLYKYE